MNATSDKETIRRKIIDAGASSVGFAKAGPVDENDTLQFASWLSDGCNAGMEYMNNHADMRRDPSLLLDGAETVIVAAFPYAPERMRDPSMPMISRYAYGEDYHKALRRRLKPVCRWLGEEYGAHTRICIDSAPVREKYWASKAGVALRGLNTLAILPGKGSFFFLAEILTDLKMDSDAAIEELCEQCGRCLAACPTGALRGDGTLDSRRCLSYLTIEHRGQVSQGMPGLGDTLFGCDRCQDACPHNRHAVKGLPEFQPSDTILEMTRERLFSLSCEQRRELLQGSPILRRFRNA